MIWKKDKTIDNKGANPSIYSEESGSRRREEVGEEEEGFVQILFTFFFFCGDFGEISLVSRGE